MRSTLQSKPAERTPAAAASCTVQRREAARSVQRTPAVEDLRAVTDLASAPRIAAQRKQLQAAFGPAVQRVAGPEEEELQMKAAPGMVQRKGPDEDELLQGKFAPAPAQFQAEPTPARNNTSLPDDLKSGIESLSGISMDNVTVHDNSSEPAQLHALTDAPMQLSAAPDGIQCVRIKKVDAAPMAENKFGQDVPSASDLEAWEPVWAGIDDALPDAAKMDALINRFRANPVGFTYSGAARTWALQGDCGSLARTFKALAENVLQIAGVGIGMHNGSPGWYLPPGFHEIDPVRHPNVDNGGYYFGTSHVWVTWNGTVFDVLFGERGQNGGVANECKSVTGEDGKRSKSFRIGDQWFKPGAAKNTYVSTPPPPV